MSVRGEVHLTLNGEAQTFPLESPRFTIGRGAENSLCIPQTVVSRSHAELIRVGNGFMLRDLGSTNGSYINSARISEQMLNDGDLIRFGSAGPEITFQLIETEGATGPLLPRHEAAGADGLIHSLTGQLKIQHADVREEANLRRVLAEAHLNKGAVDRALDVLSKYNDTTQLIALPPSFRAGVLLCIGRVYLERKEMEIAIDALQRSLGFFSQSGEGKSDDTGIAGAHAALGRAMISAGDLLAARDHLHRAMLAARRAGNVRLRAESHYLLGKVEWKEGDFEGARYNWGRAARLAEETSDDLLKGRVELQQALVLYTEGRLKEAIPVYQSAIQMIEKTGNVRLLLKGYSSLSRVLTRLGTWTATERLLADRLKLAREQKLSKAEAVAMTDLAELKLLQGDLPAAWQSIEQAVAGHGAVIYARTQRILGRILQARHQLSTAIDAYEKGLTAARDRGAIEEQVLLGFELALAHVENADLANARGKLEGAEAATSLDPALNLMARALFTRGTIHTQAGELSEANRAFGQSLSIFQTISDPYRTAVCHGAIGSLRLRQSRPESARAHLEEASREFAKLGAMIDLRRAEAMLASSTLADVPAAMTSMLPPTSGTARLSMAHKGRTGSLPTTSLPAIERILVAVANDELAAILKRGLEVENYLVDRVQDGREAMERTRSRAAHYQLLILDALLEHQSGFDICRDLRKEKRETPVILLGGRQGLEDKIEALQSGADDFLSKRGIVFEELLAKVDALLR
ncbi:MAG: tetratricopeptide repeat protein [Blastocatellia bacterium]